MEDSTIIALYNDRNELAIAETDKKYGVFCHTVARNLLQVKEDAEECVQDTYRAAWDTIPPSNPSSLRVFLGRIVRNLSISRHRKLTAQKRDSGLTVLLSELEDCIPETETVEQAYERTLLIEIINKWLYALPPNDCALFVRRYWFGESLKKLAQATDVTEGQLATRMYTLRLQLRKLLEKEDFML